MGSVPNDLEYSSTLSTANEQGTTLRSFKLWAFDPAKPDTFKGWLTALSAGLSDSTAAAIRMGHPPTYADAYRILGPHADEDQVRNLVAEMCDQWGKAQAEAYRVITLSLDFKSPKGKVLLERIGRVYSKERAGIDLLLFMRNKFTSHLSFSKQQLLIEKLQPEVLAAEVAEIACPDAADDYFTSLYGDTWLEIMGNKPTWPLDFIRRVLLAMSTAEGRVSQLAFTHTCALDSTLLSHEEAEWSADTGAGMLSPIYQSAELFIAALSKSWPTIANARAFTLKRVPRGGGGGGGGKGANDNTKCLTCNCKGCDGDPCFVLNAGRKLDESKLSPAQIKFINIARAYVAKHGAAGLKKVAFSVWKRGGDTDADGGSAKATRSEETCGDNPELDAQLGHGAIDPDTLAELLSAAGYEIDAEICDDEDDSPMLNVTQSELRSDPASHVKDVLEQVLEHDGDVESATERLMRAADNEGASSPDASSRSARSSPSVGASTPAPAAVRVERARGTPARLPTTIAEFESQLQSSPTAAAAEATPRRPAIETTVPTEAYRGIIRALVEARSALPRVERRSDIADFVRQLGVWRLVQAAALMHLADSLGAGRLLRRVALSVWAVARSLGGKAAEALLDKFIAAARVLVARLNKGLSPAPSGLALATLGVRAPQMNRASELQRVLTDNCATENITKHLQWFLPDSVTRSSVGRYQGCEQGGGVVATKEGIVPMLVRYHTDYDNTPCTGLILRKWQYSEKLDSSLFSEAFERSQMKSLFIESRGDNGQTQRSIHLDNGWIVPLSVNSATGISRLQLLCSPARLVHALNGVTPRGQLSARIKLEAPPHALMTTIGGGPTVARSMTREFECVHDEAQHPLKGSLLMMATNVGMSKVTLTPSETMALWHVKLSHAPVHRIIMTAASKMLSGMGTISSLKPDDVRGFMLTGCEHCNAAKLKRPAVSSRPSGMPPPLTSGARGDKHRNRVDGKTRVEFDTFGPVDPPSVEGFVYVRQFYIKELVRDGQSYLRAGRVLYGSKSKDEADAVLCLNRFLADIGSHASECDVLRVDDAKETKGREFLKALAVSLIRGEINPGYMHHLLGGCEIGWYVGVAGGIANLKNYGDDKRQWFGAMMHAFHAEDVLAIKDADGKLTSAFFRRTGRTADGSVLAPYGCPVKYLIDKSLRTKFEEHGAPGKYRGPSHSHLGSVRVSSKNGAMLNVHAGMVVPDVSSALLPHSPSLREHAVSSTAAAAAVRFADSPPAAAASHRAALPPADASLRSRRNPATYGSYGADGSFAPGKVAMLTLASHGMAPPSIMTLQAGDKVSAEEHTSIRSGIGGLSYVSHFRFDVAQPFSRLGRVQAAPPPEAGVALDHVIRALLETADDTWTVGGPGITEFTPMPDTEPLARDASGNYIKNYGGHSLSDANLENPVCISVESATTGARSMLCYAIMLGGAALDFSASRALSMAADSTVAELFAMVTGMTKCIILRRCLIELGYGYAAEGPWPHWSDSEGSINVCSNVSAPKRTLWVARRARLGQEIVEEGHCTPKHCDGVRNPCDSGTKRTATRTSVRDFGYLMGSDVTEWDDPPPAKLFAVALSNGDAAVAAMAAATQRESAEFERDAEVDFAYEVRPLNPESGPADTAPEIDSEVQHVLHSVKQVVDANSAAKVMADAPGSCDDFLLEPDDASAAETIAFRLNAECHQSDDGGHKLLACFSLDEDNVFLAMQADGSVSLLTRDGIVEVAEPSGFRQAMKSAEREKWLQSMGVEVQNFKDTNTYSLVPLASVAKGTPIFQLVWKYKLKRKADGTLDKYKSRCVLMGNRMIKGRDYSESFAIGARMTSIRLVFAICAVHGLIDFTVDIRGAYLNAKKPSEGVGSETYVWQPPGFEETGPNGERLVGLLNSYVYGDPEAGRAWATEFSGHLVDSVGAKMCDSDPNLGRVDHDLGFVIFAKYVDELIAAGSTPEVVAWFTEAVSSKYAGCTSGEWDTLLGFGVVHDRANRTVSVSARKLIHDLARRRNLMEPSG